MFEKNVEKIMESDNSDLRKLQLVIFEMMKVIDRICRENNIEYWIDSGTLLGAVRHGGFIPWDDDCDICMPREDYERFGRIVEKYLPEGIMYENKYSKKRCQTEVDIQPSFAKIYYLKYFKGFERASNEKCIGAFIDIFPCDSVNKDMVSKKWAKYLHKIGFFRKTRPKSIRDYVKLFLQKIDIEEIWIKYCKRQEKKNRTDSFVYGIDTPFMDERWRIKKDLIYPLKDYEFEGYKFRGPDKYDEYLKRYYGDYMKFPPEEERVPHIINLEI